MNIFFYKENSKKGFGMFAVLGIIAILAVIVFFVYSGTKRERTALDEKAPSASLPEISSSKDAEIKGVEIGSEDKMLMDEKGKPVETAGAGSSSQPAGEGVMEAGPLIKEFSVTGTSFSFSPSTIRVKKGDAVRINFTNAGGFHDLVIDEFNAQTRQIPAGASETINFIADKAGSFEYYCSVGTHRKMGMVGRLVVEE